MSVKTDNNNWHTTQL